MTVSAERERKTWLPVVGYEAAYEVSSDGDICSLTRRINGGFGGSRIVRGVVLTPYSTPTGHLTVALSADGRRRTMLVHRIVLEAFIGPCPTGMEGCHSDGNPANNHLSNLRWDTRSGNVQDTLRHGHHNMASKTHCPAGHEYTPENTIRVTGRSSRWCRECSRVRVREYMRNKRAKERAS